MAKYKDFHSYKHQFKDTSPKRGRLRLYKTYFTPPQIYLDAIQQIIELIPRLKRMQRISEKYQTSLKVVFYKEKEFSISGTMYKIENVDGYPMLKTKSIHDDDGVFQKLDSNWSVEREYECIMNYIKIFYGEDDFFDIKDFFGNYQGKSIDENLLRRRYRYIDSNSSSSSISEGSQWIVISHSTRYSNSEYYKFR